jgi:sterol desaturase/sphingolipid hydroxylase (fatty acid hydroxylase superfamily)
MAQTASIFDCKTLPAFHRAFFALPEIRLYGALCLASAATAGYLAQAAADALIPILIVVLGYPVFEYILHRGLLHGTFLCKTQTTARVWWRIHYRHHAQPRDAEVILAAPWTLIVAVFYGAVLASSLWWSPAGFAAALTACFFAAILYEYVHSLDHSRVVLSGGYLSAMRRHHITHHYFNERGNYGIATRVIDRLLGTVLTSNVQSPTVRNLGYGDELARAYPYIQRIESERGHASVPETP